MLSKTYIHILRTPLKDGSTQFPWIFSAFVLLLLATCNVTYGQLDVLIRNHVPEAWQAESVNWARDIQPANKIDDSIDNSDQDQVDVIINYRRCIDDADLASLAAIGGVNRVQMRSRYISSVFMRAMTKREIRQLAASTDVAFIEKQNIYELQLATSLQSIAVTPGPSSPQTAAEQFPLIDGTGVNIAIIDSGVDDGVHGSLPLARFVAGYNAITKTVQNPDDVLGHGTHVASIALGQASGAVSRGVAPGAGLIDVKVTDTPTFLSPALCDALETVYQNRSLWNVGVINMSLTTSSSDTGIEALNQLVDLAESMGIVVVAAAGNYGPANTGIGSPGAATRAITVAAVDTMNTAVRGDDQAACFTNIGPRASDSDSDTMDELKPELAAPGAHVVSNQPICQGVTGILAARFNTPNGSIRRSGSSMAAPHVAGAAALILQARPGINPASLKALLIATATPIGVPSNPMVDPIWNDASGWGEINVFSALNAAGATDLTFPSHPANPGWLSPDISTAAPPKVGVPNFIIVKIRNKGSVQAVGARIHFGIHVYSVATPTFHDIGTLTVTIPPGTSTHSFPWTPLASNHQCAKVEIGYGPDTDYSNNTANRNLSVQASPVFFTIQNTLTEESAVVRLVAAMGTNTLGGTNWAFELEPRQIRLSANDCPAQARAELFPGAGTRPGERQTLHVAAIIDTPFGPQLVGGVTIEAINPEAPQIVSQPADLTAECGGSAILSVRATGAPEPQYQWRRDGADLEGATRPDLELSALNPDLAGTYSVVISNRAGTVTSRSARLVVSDSGPPRLSVTLVNREVQLNWGRSCGAYNLEEAATLSSPIPWLPFSGFTKFAGDRFLATLTPSGGARFFRLRRVDPGQIPETMAAPGLTFLETRLTEPPQAVGATQIEEVPWVELEGALTDAREATLRALALDNPAFRQLLGARFAFVSADQEETAKGEGNSPIIRLTYFSHERNSAVQAIMIGDAFSDLVRRPDLEPPAGADEIQEALDLARADDRLRGRVTGLIGDGMVLTIESQAEPGFGKRVLYVTFSKNDHEELPIYSAVVDLTTPSVIRVITHQ
jgi:serine protease AprX